MAASVAARPGVVLADYLSTGHHRSYAGAIVDAYALMRVPIACLELPFQPSALVALRHPQVRVRRKHICSFLPGWDDKG